MDDRFRRPSFTGSETSLPHKKAKNDHLHHSESRRHHRGDATPSNGHESSRDHSHNRSKIYVNKSCHRRDISPRRNRDRSSERSPRRNRDHSSDRSPRRNRDRSSDRSPRRNRDRSTESDSRRSNSRQSSSLEDIRTAHGDDLSHEPSRYNQFKRPLERHGRSPGRQSFRSQSSSLTSSFQSLSTSRDSSSRSSHSECEFFNSEFHPIRSRFDSSKQPVKEGDSKDLTGNYFLMTTSQKKIYHYDVKLSQDDDLDEGVEVDPNFQERVEKFLGRHAFKIMDEFRKLNKFDFKFVYDGFKNLFVTKKFPTNPKDYVNEFVFNLNPNIARTRKTKVELNLAQTLDLGMFEEYLNNQRPDLPNILIQVMNLIFRNYLSEHFCYYQNKYFLMDKFLSDPMAPFLDFIAGFELSVRLAQIGVSLVVNPKVGCTFSHKCEKLMDLIQKIDNDFPARINFEKINSFIKNIRIFTTHGELRRTYIVGSLIRKTPVEYRFPQIQNGQEISVYEYFQNRYSISVNPDFPLVKTARGEHLPLEMCFVQNQQFLAPSKINADIQTVLLRRSEFKPAEFFSKVQEYVNEIISIDSNYLKEFGIKIINHPSRFYGYQIGKPKMLYQSNPFRITESGPSLNWGIISFDDRVFTRTLEQFTDQIKRQAERITLNLGQLKVVACSRIENLEDIVNSFERVKDRIKFCLVVIPEKHHRMNPSDIYNISSSLATQQFNLKIQCVKGPRVCDPPRGYFNNLLYEINGKLGGQNRVIDPIFLQFQIDKKKIDLSKTMLIGVDVNHPGLRESVRVSIAVATGSYNQELSKYVNSIRVQKRNSTELIDQLDVMFQELMEKYREKNDGRLPQNLIVFRDGVSEGQFDQVVKEELPLIRKAIDIMDPTKRIRTTLIIVQKRHQTRFVTTRPYREQNGRPTQNVPSGTIVDNTINEPNFDIFYVNSHFSRLGTSKPTKYIVMMDEVRLTNAELHKLCYFVCFNCVRNMPMSLPTPVFYADLCAYKSKIHIMSHCLFNQNRHPGGDDIQNEESFIQRLQQWVEIKFEETKDSFFYV